MPRLQGNTDRLDGKTAQLQRKNIFIIIFQFTDFSLLKYN